MKHGGNKHPYGVLALAARTASRFVARCHTAKRRDAWRPIALFWRQKRKGLESVQATRLALKTGVVRLAQFYLHFVIRENDRTPRHSTHGLSPVAVIQSSRVVMDYQRIIDQSGIRVAQPSSAPNPVRFFSIRYARSDSGTKVRNGATYARPSRQPIISSTATWVAGRARRPNPGRTHLSVRLGTSADTQTQTYQVSRINKRELYLFHSHSGAISNTVRPHSQESSATQLHFYPQELVWHRTRQPSAETASNERQVDLREVVHQAHGRSYSEKEATSGMSQAFEHTPALKIDSGLVDRLADDVIRRVERRARIERERRGL
jgi:hypothetical protein